ncbi:MAG: hypothetical protein U5K99_02100 [Anaerolineales bacterium]|nr:hypothetical protein [Anaerolineales bacterium]
MKKLLQKTAAYRFWVHLGVFLIALSSSFLLYPAAKNQQTSGIWILLGLITLAQFALLII